MFMASNDVQVTVISGWNGSGGSMGPGGHIRSLDLVMGGLTGAQWVQNDRLGGSFLLIIPIPEGVERHALGLQCHQSCWNSWLE